MTTFASAVLATVIRVSGPDVNRAVLVAVLEIIETWIERDRSELVRINGGVAAPDSQVATKAMQAYAVLKDLLPVHAHANLIANMERVAPRETAPVGQTARHWARHEYRLKVARSLLASAQRAEETSSQRAEDARKSAQEKAARLKAQQERDAEEKARQAAAAEAEARRRAERAAAMAAFRDEAVGIFRKDFLTADAWFDTRAESGQVTRSDFDSWKASFVQEWVRTVLNDDAFDEEQARAVASTSRDLRLIARAGSGKTRTIVTRALFLQLHCGVDPGAIVLVAFNRKAVEEISRRLARLLPRGAPLPHVLTFHALAYALLRPDEELVFDDEDSETLAQSRKVQAIVDDLLLKRKGDIRRAMLGFFKDDWKAIKRRGLDMTREEFFASRAEVTRVTLGGEYVKSFGERVIANVLFEHGIDYKYERNFTRGGFNYRPDFTVLVNGKPRLVIEYFGVTGDPKYAQNAERKRAFWREQPDIAFAEFAPSDIASLGEEGFSAKLLSTLDDASIAYRLLSEDEVWELVRQRAIDTFSKAVRQFVNRSRQLNLTAEDIRQRTYALEEADDNVVSFLSLAAEVYEEYLARTRRDGFEDFSGVMWRASAAVRAGHVNWTRSGGKEHGDLQNVRFMHIDEFQDFSEMFMEFVQALRSQAPDAVLCCVGDDWQAINRFAGADLRFFEDFETDFSPSETRQLVTNYRSGRSIVSAGNSVMAGMGKSANAHRPDAGSVRIADLADFTPSITESQIFQGDIGTPALLRLIARALEEGPGQIAVLFRRNTVPWFTSTGQGAFGRKLDGYLTYVRGHLSENQGQRLEFTTAHKYKGREASCVIVADADEKSYPLIHPTARLFEVFGDSLDRLTDSDRRLFYVATTRAESDLCYLVTSEEPSRFLAPVVGSAERVDWRNLPPVLKGLAGQVEIRVYDAYEVHERLRDDFNFSWDPSSKTWYAFRQADGFDFEKFQADLAFVGQRLVEIRDESGSVIRRAGSRARF